MEKHWPSFWRLGPERDITDRAALSLTQSRGWHLKDGQNISSPNAIEVEAIFLKFIFNAISYLVHLKYCSSDKRLWDKIFVENYKVVEKNVC